MKWTVFGGTVAAIVATTALTWAQDITTVSFGSTAPLKIVAPKGMTASGYSSVLFENYNNILASNAPLNRYITPADVVVLCPPATTAVLSGKMPTTSTIAGKFGKTSTPMPVEAKLPPTGTYIIYVMGRRFITVDPALAKANGMTSSGAMAARLARRFMQSFPRECFRPPSLPALTNIPANPALRLTTNLEQCIPTDVVGRVYLAGKGLYNAAKVQPDGSTGPDKAAILTRKTTKVLTNRDMSQPGKITAVKNGKNTDIKVDTAVLYTLSDFDAKSNGFANAATFGKFLATQIEKRLESGAPVTTPPPTENVPVPATPAPTAPATPPL